MDIAKKYLGFFLQIFFFILVSINENTEARHTDKWRAYILGGEQVHDISEFPYVLSMRYIEFHICGASIIQSYWALTAAHCLEVYHVPEVINFRGGSINKNYGGKIILAEQLFLHPNYDDFSYDNDVAVVKTQENLIQDKMEAIPLVGFNSLLISGVIGTISGWGIQVNGSRSNHLQKLNLEILSKKYCFEKWHGKFTGSMFCAGGESGYDSCTGDSGGAMTVNGFQIGIISAGSKVCGIGFPGLFVDLTNFHIRSFISETTGV